MFQFIYTTVIWKSHVAQFKLLFALFLNTKIALIKKVTLILGS